MSEEEKKNPAASQEQIEQQQSTASSEPTGDDASKSEETEAISSAAAPEKEPDIASQAAEPAADAGSSADETGPHPQSPTAEAPANGESVTEEAPQVKEPTVVEGSQAKEPTEVAPKPAPPADAGKEATPASPPVDAEREAKLKAAAEARAARAAAKAKAEAEAAEAAQAEQDGPKEPSPRQNDLDRYVRLIEEIIGTGTVVESGLNELNADMPMIVLAANRWEETGLLLRDHEELGFDYLRNVSGIDYETHLEVVYYLLSLETKQDVAIKLRTDREAPSIPSATLTWSTANWNEREIFDLLGIHFSGHPDLRRIMMPDDWVGHPLRKDYEPLDSEV